MDNNREFWTDRIIYDLMEVVQCDTAEDTEYHLAKALENLSELVQLVARQYGVEENELVA
jgi:ribosomal protein S7